MAIQDEIVIDAVGIDKISGNVILSILDSYFWNKENKHLELLQNKINRYLDFIESGEIDQAYKDVHDKNKEIHIYYKYEPGLEGLNFLDTVTEFLNNKGINFKHEKK